MSLLVVDHPFPNPKTAIFNYSMVRRVLASNPSLGNETLMLWGRPANNTIRQHIYTNVVRAKADRAVQKFTAGVDNFRDHNMIAIMGSVYSGTLGLEPVEGLGGPFLYLPGDAHADPAFGDAISFGIFVNHGVMHVFYYLDDVEDPSSKIMDHLSPLVAAGRKWRPALRVFWHVIAEQPYRDVLQKKKELQFGVSNSMVGVWRISGSVVIYPMVFRPMYPDFQVQRAVSFGARPTWESVVKSLDELKDLMLEMQAQRV